MKFYKYKLFNADVYESEDEIEPFKSFWDMIWKMILYCLIIPIIVAFLFINSGCVLGWIANMIFV